MRAYFINSLAAWHRELKSDQRRGMARHKRMIESGHPDASDQFLLLSIRQCWISQIEQELASAVTRPDREGQQ